METDKLTQPPVVAYSVVKHFDALGNPTDPHQAVRVVTTEFDKDNNVICTRLIIEPTGLNRK